MALLRVTLSRGFTLVELLVVLVILGVLVSLAVPSFRRAIDQIRARAALDQLTGDLYHARLLAVREGRSVQLVLQRDPLGCVRAYRIATTTQPLIEAARSLPPLPDLCLRHTGDSVVTFSARGMLRPPARSFSVTYGGAADSVVVSIAGRVRRAYRRKRGREKSLPHPAVFSSRGEGRDGVNPWKTIASRRGTVIPTRLRL